MEYLPGEENHHIEKLFQVYHARLVHFSFHLIGDKDCAEDIVQDTFITYWGHLDRVSDNENAIKSFLYKAVKNKSLNVIRHRKVANGYRSLQDKEPSQESVMHAMIRSEVMAELYKAIASLPAHCQKISRLGYLEGKKNKEIAEELGISVNTVKTQKQRAIKLLRLKLTPELLLTLLLLYP